MKDDTVSIVAAAVTYPDAHNLTQLWDTVIHQRVAFRPMPPERLALSDYLSSNGSTSPDSMYFTSAALVSDWAFDTTKFKVPAGMYASADTTHWMALDTASKLLHELGTPDGSDLPRATTGVILGNSLGGEVARANALRLRWPMIARVIREVSEANGNTVSEELLSGIGDEFRGRFPEPGDEMLAGSLSNTIAGRICNNYDFHGTGYTVDGACSSSLLSIIVARNALLAEELDFVLAGGVDISLDPFELVGFSRLGALSHDGMRVYDEHPTGFLPGEGCGMVALMRTRDAQAAGRPILATIQGAGSSTDGCGGLTRPNADGHYLAASRAYRQAGIHPQAVSLFEGHGTGTPVGDPIELGVFRRLRAGTARPAAVGSIKANIGHTKAAAGVAGLIKAVLAIDKRILPPTTGCVTPHAILRDCDEIETLTEPREWEGPAFAGVSAMGFGGINTHVVLSGTSRTGSRTHLPATASAGRHDVWVLTGSSLPRITALIRRTTADLVFASDAEAHDLSVRLTSQADPAEPFRIGFAAASRAEARTALTSAVELVEIANTEWMQSAPAGVLKQVDQVTVGVGRASTVGLLFPGQAAHLVRAGTLLERLAGSGPFARAAATGITLGQPGLAGRADTQYAQPSIVGGSLLGLAFLAELGVTATAATGHSLGEISALAWAGAIEPEDAIALASRRGQAMSSRGIANTGMVSVAAAGPLTEELIGLLNVSRTAGDTLVIAGYNSPNQTTVSGKTVLLDELVALCRRRKVPAVRLSVSHGFHSPAMVPARQALAEAIDAITWSTPTRSIISTVTGREFGAVNPAELRTQLLDQLTTPVRFIEALYALTKQCQLLVECGPGTILAGLARQITDVPTVSLDVGGPASSTAETCAALAAAGAVRSLHPWLAARSSRTIEPGHRPAFLTNPCGVPRDPAPPEATSASQHVSDEDRRSGPDSPSAFTSAPSAAPDLEIAPQAECTLAQALTLLREALSAATGLDLTDVSGDASFSKDLHLNSLQVGQVVSKVTGLCGRAAPESPLSLTDATLVETAEVIAALPDLAQTSAARFAGSINWVTQFADHWQPVQTPASTPWPDITWTQWAYGPSIPAQGCQATGLVIDLRAADSNLNTVVVQALDVIDAVSDLQVLVIVHDGTGSALARCIHAELGQPDDILAVDTLAPIDKWLQFLPGATAGFADLRWDGHEWSELVSFHHVGPARPIRLEATDVCIVTGGLSGITAECAAEFALVHPVRLLFAGRTPSDAPEVTTGLVSLRASGVTAEYVVADVTQDRDIANLLRAASTWGHPAVLIHGAGINTPQRLMDVTEHSLAATDAVKTGALERFLRLWPDTGPDVLITFGSIIGRAGMAGQLDYSIANDRLRHATEQYAQRKDTASNKTIRHIAWSVWSQVGMGVHLGVLDGLLRSGVAPIGPNEGRRMFMEAISTDGPVTRLVTGRFPRQATVATPHPATDPARFCEELIANTPDVELVAEAEINRATDLALADHVIDGVNVLPAVMSLEAVAQAAATLRPDTHMTRFANVELPRPVTVAGSANTILRTSVALAAVDRDRLVFTVRSDNDAFGADCVKGTVEPSRCLQPCRPSQLATPERSGTHDAEPLTSLYGPLFFHGPAFQRVTSLKLVSASHLCGELTSRPEAWFSRFLPPTLRLGDPGLLDASIHVLQACFPGQRLLPVAVTCLDVIRTAHPGTYRIEATEVATTHPAGQIAFDVIVRDANGPLIQWTGLHLCTVGPLDGHNSDPMVMGAHMARRARAMGMLDLDVAMTSAVPSGSDVAAVLTGHPGWHTPAGRLTNPHSHLATSRAGSLRAVAVSAIRPVGVDLVQRGQAPSALSAADQVVAHQVGTPEPNAIVWAAREAMTKAGATGALQVGHVDEAQTLLNAPDGTVLIDVFDRHVMAVYAGTEGRS